MHPNIYFLQNNIRDFQELLYVFEEAFEWENFTLPDEAYLKKILANENFLVVAAKAENEIVGGLTAYIFHSYETGKPFIYIYDLGVKESSRNRGIGKQLIKFLRNFALENGFGEMYVTTEQEENEQVVDFYRKTPIDEEIKVLQFTYRTMSDEG